MKTKIIILSAFLASSVFAGGDDRDRGPVESLEVLVPVADQVVSGDQGAQSMKLIDQVVSEAQDEQSMKLTDQVASEAQDAQSIKPSDAVIGTANGITVTAKAHEECKDELDLPAENIQKFKNTLASGELYNTGPADEFGVEFSHNRWDDYFACIGQQ